MVVRVAIALLALTSAGLATNTLSASGRAQAWLKAHDDPDSAGMQDLRNSDPNAFAIVQALLAKKSLGLLDPKHPTASFTGAKPHEAKSFSAEAAAAGLTADTPVQVSDEPTEAVVALPSTRSQPYPGVGMHHNPWSFKAHDDDDAMVQNVLNAAADLKGSAPAQAEGSLLSDSSSVSSVQATSHASAGHTMGGLPSLDWGNTYAGTSDSSAAVPPPAAPVQENVFAKFMPAPVAPAAPVQQPQLAATQENSYLKGIDFSSELSALPVASQPKVQLAPVAQPQPQPLLAAAQQNSYLNGMDFKADMSLATQRLQNNPFHKLASSYRAEAAAAQENVQKDVSSNLGSTYDQFLKKARANRWKTALAVSKQFEIKAAPIDNNPYAARLTGLDQQ